ncbi:fluoride efflux transporter FluC [Planococcus salinus]|nr:CrcB family protein [Planococcus salinus]
MLAVGAGGMAGTLLRAWIYAVIPSGWELWVVNLLGSFLIGVAAIRLHDKSAELRLFLSTGFLGSFTTFSAFSSDWFHLLENSVVSGIAFGILMTLCSVVAAACGVWTGRKGRME